MSIRQGNYTAYDREGAKNPEEKRKMELAAYDCDFFPVQFQRHHVRTASWSTSTGTATRVSAICAGPRNVLMIVGMNKVARDVESAMSRARNDGGAHQRPAVWAVNALQQDGSLFRL